MFVNAECMARVVLKDTAEAVVVPLKGGISSLNRVYEALIKADVHPVTGQCSNYNYIRQQILQAHQHLQRSEQAASSGLKSLDKNIERLTQDEGKLEREKSSTETHLKNLRTEQAANEKLHRDSQGALEQARANLNSTKQTLRDQERKRHNAEIVTGVGAGLFAIPIVGWIAGSVMVISGAAELDQAARAIRVAIEEVEKSETDLKKNEMNVQEFVQDNTINWKDLYDQKNKATLTDFQADQFKRIKESLEKSPNCKAKTDAQSICDEGIAICAELAKYAPEVNRKKAKTKQLVEGIRKLTESARSFDSKSKDVTNSPSLAPKPPMMYKEESKSGKMRASQRASENARFRIEQSRAQLDKTREIYEKSIENMEENQKELTEILITMRNCEVKEIDFNTTIQMLVKGMDAMGRVKEQWEKMPSLGGFLLMEKSVLEEMKTSSPRMAMESGAGVRYSSQLAYGCITSLVWFLISSAVVRL
ncbi:hypothetical protein PDJAM_G00176040 [Pangasius djambal]|uniref:Uncharacterized protein n=1 Tax=Pangasius djambal TaxID=1691987 RepID=A0ACC5ZNL8_9TELE|nr:hypothetical protein [Pangasius djambal]